MNIATKQCLRIFKHAFTTQSHVCGLGRTCSYKSAYSLENLYPKSSLKLFTPKFIPENPSAKFNGYIPVDELDITYSTSSGPGGQNVNRVNTKVDLRFHVRNAKWIAEDLKEKIIEQNKTKITKDGYLIIRSELTRYQQLNLADALERLRTLIRKAAEPTEAAPISEETEERLRKRHMKAVRERLLVKRMRSQVKQDRRGVHPSEIL